MLFIWTVHVLLRACVRLRVWVGSDCVDFLFLFACLLLTCRLLKPGYSDTAVIAQSEAPALPLMSATIDVRLTLPTSPPAPHFLSHVPASPFSLFSFTNFETSKIKMSLFPYDINLIAPPLPSI